MIVGLVDVDLWARKYKCTFPNLALMKLSAWHKAKGDCVEWHNPWKHYDLVYVSKVFSSEYTRDYELPIDADKVIYGGSGYAISVVGEKEQYNQKKDPPLPEEVEHIMPDYSIYEEYGIHDTAYGFLTRGCPRGCEFCHVQYMQGRCTHTVARLSDFWSGQKYIELLDPNISASKDWAMHLADLKASNAYVSFNQGLDVRMLTADKIKDLNEIKWKRIHFAWDKPEEDLRSKFELVKEHLKRCRRYNVSVYILTNFGSTFEQDLERVMFIREMQMQPYVMIYRKNTAPIRIKKLARWINNPYICWVVNSFEEYDSSIRNNKK